MRLKNRVKLSEISVVICLLLNAGFLFAAEKPSLLPDGKHLCNINSTDTILLAENGKANAEIVVVRPGAPVAAFAARELKTFLDRATGADFKIVNERTSDLPAIFVGDSEWARAWGVEVNSLALDGFIIRRVKDIIIIAGRDDPYIDPGKYHRGSRNERGTLFGVYDFLERFAGVRFYFPGEIGTVVPKSSVLRVPGMNILEEPDLTFRQPAMDGKETWFGQSDPKEIARMQHQEMLRLRTLVHTITPCHGLYWLKYPERFGQTHPEFFILRPDGSRGVASSQLCYSNEGLMEEVYKDAEARLTGKPGSLRRGDVKPGGWDWPGGGGATAYFDAMPHDGMAFCHCPRCKPFYDKTNINELVWGFECDLARRLKKNGIPGYIGMGAYSYYQNVPDIDIPDNIFVSLSLTGPWMEKYPSVQEKDDKVIRDWHSKLKHKVQLWNYINDFNGAVPPGIPPLSTKWIAEYYKRNAPHISGAFLQSDTDHFLSQYLNWYVYMKVAWDLSTDTDKLIAEHHQKMFGPAAKPMGRFFARLEEIWTNELMGEFKDTSLGPTFVKPTELKTWEQVYSEERMNELGKLFDEAEKLAANEPDSLKRVKFFRENMFGEMIKAREAYVKRKHEIDDLVFEVTPLPAGQAITVDGVLDEPVWQTAADVFLVSAKENEPALVKTRMRALWTEKFLYLGYDCEEPKSDDIAVLDRKRDDQAMWTDTSVEIFLNPSNDRANYFQFIVNAKGNLTDVAYRSENGANVSDLNWNSRAESAARIEKGTWTVEIAIPVEDLNGKGIKNGDTMIANFNRSRHVRGGKPEENQIYTWSPFLKDGFHKLDRFGKMKFVTEKSKPVSFLKNGSFEEVNAQGLPSDWKLEAFPRKGDDSTGKDWSKNKNLFTADNLFACHGRNSLRIKADQSVIACAVQLFSGIKPDTRYLITFFIKTDDVQPTGPKGGAFINVWKGNLFFPASGYIGTIPWTKQGFVFTTGHEAGDQGGQSCIRLWLREATGTVWFDDICIREDKNG